MWPALMRSRLINPRRRVHGVVRGGFRETVCARTLLTARPPRFYGRTRFYGSDCCRDEVDSIKTSNGKGGPCADGSFSQSIQRQLSVGVMWERIQARLGGAPDVKVPSFAQGPFPVVIPVLPVSLHHLQLGGWQRTVPITDALPQRTAAAAAGPNASVVRAFRGLLRLHWRVAGGLGGSEGQAVRALGVGIWCRLLTLGRHL
mmetsp:Transcript_8373/g.25131  ORF Transcript_8373/g.25131 Transcript_8373/m.25131 type:complete len:202 (+) Transcript_8373:797-1402(+)